MKRAIATMLMVIAFSCISTMANRAPQSQDAYVAVLTKTHSCDVPPEEEGDRGHRLPGKQIECLIDRSAGVQFCNGETPQFMSYEVYDMDETPVATFLTESEFITYIFSQESDCQIRLVTADCAYIGYLSI